MIIFYHLRNPRDRSKIRLVLSPIWLKIDHWSSKFDKKVSLYVVRSTFGGVIRLKIKGDFCHLQVQLDAQKPLRRGIFISINGNEKV